jgi:ribosomal-protein-alanine N-acetyltransferase
MRWWDIERLLPIEEDLFDPEQWSAALFWSELAQAGTRHYLVAEGEQDELVGYGGMAAIGQEAMVQTLAVRRDHWGRGIGRSLLTALLEESKRRGAHTIALEVRADNERAQALYRRFGFESIGRRRGYYEKAGVDALVMRRRG